MMGSFPLEIRDGTRYCLEERDIGVCIPFIQDNVNGGTLFNPCNFLLYL